MMQANRRQFLGTTAAAAGTLAVGAAIGVTVPGSLLDRVNRRERQDDELTPLEDVISYNNFYEFRVDKSDPARHAHSLVTDPWSVTIDGAADKTGTFALEDILKPHALEERTYRLRCVEGWSMVIP